MSTPRITYSVPLHSTSFRPMASISTRAPGDPVAANLTREQAIVEAWAQGFSVGSVVILILFVLCNYRRKILLHKLILLEVGSSASGMSTLTDLETGSSSWLDGMASLFSSMILRMVGMVFFDEIS